MHVHYTSTHVEPSCGQEASSRKVWAEAPTLNFCDGLGQLHGPTEQSPLAN